MTRPAREHFPMLSNHAHVLVDIARDPTTRLRDVAGRLAITERAVFGIVTDLEAAGALERRKVGRRNQYTVHTAHRVGAEQLTVASLVHLTL